MPSRTPSETIPPVKAVPTTKQPTGTHEAVNPANVVEPRSQETRNPNTQPVSTG